MQLLENVSLSKPAVMCSVRFDAAALGTLVDDLSWFELEALDVFLGGVSFWHCTLATNINAVAVSKVPSQRRQMMNNNITAGAKYRIL